MKNATGDAHDAHIEVYHYRDSASALESGKPDSFSCYNNIRGDSYEKTDKIFERI